MSLNRFNFIAPCYDQLAQLVFGVSIKKSQTYFLNQIPDNAKILVIGGGTGWWLKELQRIKPTCRIWFVDASSTMLEKARRNIANDVTFIHGTEADIPPIQFDVVITYFFLDLFSDEKMMPMIERLIPCLTKEGIWLVSDFVNNKVWHAVFLSLMYFFFKTLGALTITKLYSWQENLADQNLTCVRQVYFFKGFITSCLYQRVKE